MEFRGLTDQQVEQSRARHGSNVIPEAEPVTFWQEFGRTFRDPMIRILLVIAILMLLMYFFGYAEIYEPAGTVLAIVIVAAVSAKTGVTSDVKYRTLKESARKDTCKVYRNGQVVVLEADEVVVGDKVLLQAGDKIPADGILLDGALRVNNAALNGETEECKKTAASAAFELAEKITGETFVDAHSLFRGTIVFDGTGVLDVRRVGVATMMGRMAQELQEEEPDSPLQVKLTRLAGQISRVGYVGAVVIAALYFIFFVLYAGGLQNYLSLGWGTIFQNIIESVSLAVVIIVCAVPEGLPLMISLVLMQNTSKMLAHNVLVRKAEGIETAGSLNILFSDKTGTITKGLLEVVEFFTADGNTIPTAELAQCQTVQEQLQLAIGKNTAAMYDANHQVIGGNATDQALLKFLGEDAFRALESKGTYTVTASQGFHSANKFSQAYIEGLQKTYYKGAPEQLVAKAKYYLDKQGQRQPLDVEALNRKIDGLAAKAVRVLAFGYGEQPLQENRIQEDLVLIGLVGIWDDVRPEARAAIGAVQQAGIQVVMITGDRLETAMAIAKDAGLLSQPADRALTSADLQKLSDDDIKAILPELKVIARALPTDKSRMVRLCQELNLVVGMTGDGVNDAPALKRADVGFAMGSGTEAAKEAGKIVILDDNFQSIKDAIWYGRTIYHNILKFCRFQLVINLAAVAVSALAPFLGLGEPLKVIHLLFINLIMDSLGAIMLGNEPALEQYMQEKPRRRDEAIISKAMLGQIAVMGVWLTLLSFAYLRLDIFHGVFINREQILSAFFVLFIASALFNAFNVRGEGFDIFRRLQENTGFLKVFFIILAVLVLIVNAGKVPLAPFQWISAMFSCVPFSWQGWVLVLLLAATMIPIDLLRKAIIRRRVA